MVLLRLTRRLTRRTLDRERRSQRRAAPGSPSTSYGALRAPRRQTGWHVWGWSFEEGRRARKEKREREHMRGLHTSIPQCPQRSPATPFFFCFLPLSWLARGHQRATGRRVTLYCNNCATTSCSGRRSQSRDLRDWRRVKRQPLESHCLVAPRVWCRGGREPGNTRLHTLHKNDGTIPWA